MHDVPPIEGLTNAAWASITTKLNSDELFLFCENVERLFRLNPYLNFQHWQQLDQNFVDIRWDNTSNENAFSLNTRINIQKKPFEIHLKYETGVKRETFLLVKTIEDKSELIIVDNYGSRAEESLAEVDRSINAWAESLNKFFRHYAYIRHIPFIDFLLDKFWLRLKPMARRITYMLFVVTLVELMALMLFIIFTLLT